jgi:hypothetical protein
MSDHNTVKILFLAANPQDTTWLQIAEEMRAVDQVLRKAEQHNWFDLRLHGAVRVDDLQELFLSYQPHIVHFSGHGSSTGEIILQASSGDSHPVSISALNELFAVLKDNIRCVVLNACYSKLQAQAIAQHIDCVIGMSEEVGDKASISFATAFYRALGFGRDVKTAFELGCGEIKLKNLAEHNQPILITTNVNPRRIFFIPSSEPMYVPLIDREEVIELFHRFLNPFTTKRIIRLLGEPKMGKTHLLTKVFPTIAHQHATRCIILDLRNPDQDITTHLNNACELLGYTRFQTFKDLYQEWINQDQIQFTGLQSLASFITLWNQRSKAMTDRMRYRLTRCFVDDLRQLDDHPLVLIFDAVDNATDATKMWLMDNLLVQLYQLPHVRVIIGGRILPEACGTYAAACYNLKLQPVEKVEAYIHYCQEVNANLPEQAIPVLAKVLSYTPGIFAEAIEANFLNGTIIDG